MDSTTGFPTIHVDDFAFTESPSDTETVRQVKAWLRHYRLPAIEHDRNVLGAAVITTTHHGKRYRLTGCSRMGDVWLAEDPRRTCGYDHRVDVAECMDWEVKAVNS